MITRLAFFLLFTWLQLFLVSPRIAFSQKLVSPDSSVTTLGRRQPNTLLIKLKPKYGPAAATPRRQASQPNTTDPLQQVLKQIKTNSYRQKFPEASTSSNLQPGQVDVSLWYEIQYQKRDFSFTQLRHLFLATGLVDHVEPVYLPEILYQPNDPLADSTTGKQYYLKKIRAYQAWEVEKGDSAIVIGILDTGTRLDHEDLIKNLKRNYADPVDGLDNDNDGFVDNYTGWDTADNDNDPTDPNGHGTWVTGMAAGTPENGKGIAGVGFNCLFLPVKVFSYKANHNFGGYEGIVYAADHGCQVINLSWGGENPYSQFEQDVINYAAINKNAVIIAAAGNTPKETYFYPASYENVLSVSSVNQNDVKERSQTYNYRIDLTAPGVNVTTTSSNSTNTYAAVSGSSLAAPIVAGAAGLLRQKFPAYTSEQIVERLRVTADNHYGAGTNRTYLEKIGYGRLNLYQALTASQPKAIRNTNNTYDPQQTFAGKVLPISGTFKNILAPTTNLFVTLSSLSPFVTVIRSTYVAGAMATLTSQTNTEQPFQVLISEDIPANQPVVFRYGFTDGAYTDYQYFTLVLNAEYLSLTVGNLDATLTSTGNLGYNNLNPSQGESVLYKNFGPLLSEGGLLLGTAPETVSDNVRNPLLQPDEDFEVLRGVQFADTGKRADEEAYGAFRDKHPEAGMVGVTVKQRAFAWQNIPDDQYVILEYQITNTTQAPLTNLHAGLFADWDIAGYTNNSAAWDSITRTGYTYHPDEKNLYAGVSLLTSQTATTYAFSNPPNSREAIDLGDGFTDAEKFTALQNTSQQNRDTGATGSDVAQVVGSKFFNLAPGQSTTVAFALLGAESLLELQQNARAALTKYQLLKAGLVLVKQIDSVCIGKAVTIRPEGGQNFRFYADSEKKELLKTGANFTTLPLQAAATYYISNIDSLYESPLTAVSIIPANSTIDFSFSPDPVPASAKGLISFTNQTADARQWRWDFGNGSQSPEQNPRIQYTQPGIYPVTLHVTNRYGCTDSLTKNVHVPFVDYIRQWQDADILMYPIPTPQTLKVAISAGIDASNGLSLSLINSVGRTILEKVTYQTALQLFDLSNLANGIYYLRVSGQDGVITRRVEVLR